jgi:DNA-binding NtrC family response regulator
MLVDDDADLRFAIRRFLESMSHTVIDADGGRIAIQKLRTAPVDVVISDLFMPDGDGLDLVRDVARGWPEIRLIVITSGGTLGICDLLPAAQLLGASATFRKPVELQSLLHVIERTPIHSK